MGPEAVSECLSAYLQILGVAAALCRADAAQYAQQAQAFPALLQVALIMGCAISGVFAVIICCSRNVWARMFTKDAAVAAAFAGIAIPLGLALLGEFPLCKPKLCRCIAQPYRRCWFVTIVLLQGS